MKYHGSMVKEMQKILLLVVSTIFVASFNKVLADDYNPVSTFNYKSAQTEFEEYIDSMKDKIAKQWNVPENTQEGHAVVVFRLNRNGDVVLAEIAESSGNVSFDEIALGTLAKSAPFGNFPETTTRTSLDFKYTFETKIAQTDVMQKYLAESEKYFLTDKKLSLFYLDKAIAEIKGDSAAYFMYARRSKLNKALGNIEESENDLSECKRLKVIYDQKRIAAAKTVAEKEKTAFSYFSLANAYDIAGNYNDALEIIDKAIAMTPLNQGFKRYRLEIAARADAKK